MRLLKGRWIIGLIVILFGVSLLLENLGLAEIDFSYILSFIIPILLILWGIEILIRRQGIMSNIGGLILLIIGFNIIGRRLGWFDFELSIIWDLFWPVIFILIGLSIITSVKPGAKNNLALMGAIEKTKAPWRLENDTYTAVMGGIELDLRLAEIPEGETDIKLTAIMGGIDIVVPHNITVRCKGNVILGGLEYLDRSTGGIIASLEAEQMGNSRVVNITGNAVMGGIDIKSRMA